MNTYIVASFTKYYLSADSHHHIKIWRERCSWADDAFNTNFASISGMVQNDGTPYDFGSIMHYRPTTCSNSSHPVITKPDGTPINVNKTDTFSFWDIEQINHVYNCEVDNLKPEGEYCIKLESNCSETVDGSTISLFHNNIKIETIPTGFENYEHCLPLHWVNIEKDTFKLRHDGGASSSENVSCSLADRKIS